ncbi:MULTISPECIES: SMC-Scp complex subunit ScpB [Paenarthrobacter]|jgi:segregation and condensation protein B|uniref:Segregation and condensation protein B n=1 Tax=Paenarthrobacter nicotinovorans TaxID=29320 RepID=A0ABT9TPM8_PAENI|nr:MULTISPECIES: SMC-Scp complex subunit ScpB [Paenarthrobacter]SKB93148.1 condensin subunit ScpB [Arthrobacter sp. 31Cvi3.1E]BCW10320.1 segregation and condensation protein B [Arthrobacter sp. NtRootA2]BCW14401.1 segregation and condensation protein B [Arthrobacter sp. NtRootA4]BCW22736.1 segregation and condensation protein B [Arthrobacter sp. NtRootC7]BCW27005.1 segregation and condensation protein B [Arthrobacter sp. NtRootC45]BCW31274.1 segregation and condensation protein B [Arthrobacte
MSEQEAVQDGLAELEALPGGARAALEAVLMVIDQPATSEELAAGLNVTVAVVEDLLEDLRREYSGYTVKAPDVDAVGFAVASTAPRGFELRNVAGGWRIYSRSDFADIVGRFVLEGQTTRLTQAALETLAVIAYRQPVSRARVSAIRGVNVDSVVRTLTQRGLIEDSGTDPESGAVLYRTTSYFLERMGIGSVAELPQLSPHLPGLEGIDEYYDASRM